MPRSTHSPIALMKCRMCQDLAMTRIGVIPRKCSNIGALVTPVPDPPSQRPPPFSTRSLRPKIMSTAPGLNEDVFEEILDLVADDFAVLRVCALVCSGMRPVAQRQLFRRCNITGGRDGARLCSPPTTLCHTSCASSTSPTPARIAGGRQTPRSTCTCGLSAFRTSRPPALSRTRLCTDLGFQYA
jgi:hypothetical protein